MFRKTFKVLAILCVTTLAACSTQGQFVVPEGSSLYLGGRPTPVDVGASGTVVTKPFGWNAMGLPPQNGIPYKLEKNGKIIKEGKLRAVFRGASLFWPPFAGVFVVPTGLNPNITYNLVTGKQE